MLWHRYDSAGGLALIAVTAFLGQMPMQRVSMILMSRRRSRALNSVRRTDLKNFVLMPEATIKLPGTLAAKKDHSLPGCDYHIG